MGDTNAFEGMGTTENIDKLNTLKQEWVIKLVAGHVAPTSCLLEMSRQAEELGACGYAKLVLDVHRKARHRNIEYEDHPSVEHPLSQEQLVNNALEDSRILGWRLVV